MRGEFFTGLADLLDRDPRVVLLTADLGFGFIDLFANRHPDRLFNVGVAEQAMVGMAVGLAEGGFHPYCYSIASFAVGRTWEFLRNGPIAHGLPVRLVGVGPGMDYSFDGLTHFAIEDIGLLANQPNCLIVAPSDGPRAGQYASQGTEFPGLVYYRLARSARTSGLARLSESLPGSEVLVFGVGDAGSTAEEIVAALGAEASGIALEEFNAATLKGLAARIGESPARVVVTAENHYAVGGVGTLLSDALMTWGWQGRLVKWGVEACPLVGLGSPEYMRSTYTTSIDSLVARVKSFLSR